MHLLKLKVIFCQWSLLKVVDGERIEELDRPSRSGEANSGTYQLFFRRPDNAASPALTRAQTCHIFARCSGMQEKRSLSETRLFQVSASCSMI